MFETFKHHIHKFDDFIPATAIEEAEHDGPPELTARFPGRVLPRLTVHLPV